MEHLFVSTGNAAALLEKIKKAMDDGAHRHMGVSGVVDFTHTARSNGQQQWAGCAKLRAKVESGQLVFTIVWGELKRQETGNGIRCLRWEV